MKIKDQIRSRREALGMEMSELGRRIGVTEQAVRHWESGRSYPGRGKVQLLEEALSMTLDWTEGRVPAASGNSAASMIRQEDVDLLLSISLLPLRLKVLIGDLVKAQVEALKTHRPSREESVGAASVRGAAADLAASLAVERGRLAAAKKKAIKAR